MLVKIRNKVKTNFVNLCYFNYIHNMFIKIVHIIFFNNNRLYICEIYVMQNILSNLLLI